MKITLQAYEPRQHPFGNAELEQAMVRKERLRFSPVVADLRLFHAFRA